MEIAIRYCAERGFEDAALVFARRLFAEFDDEIASLALVPVDDEDLAVYLDGRLVHSTSQAGRLPRMADVRVGRG
jgi:predicted Rdx family selenoprotein